MCSLLESIISQSWRNWKTVSYSANTKAGGLMLRVYRYSDELPKDIKFVRDNDAYFDAKSKLLDTDLVRKILLEIDGAEYVSEDIFSSKNKKVGNLNKIHLSTGVKTLINILNFKDVCFDVLECGINVLDLIPEISIKTDGYILWRDCMYPFAENCDCDFLFRGKRFYKVFDFMGEIYGNK